MMPAPVAGVGGWNRFRQESVDGRKEAEATNSRLAAIVEWSDDAIMTDDIDGVITSWNEAAQRIFGYAAHEVIGERVTLLIPADREDEEAGVLERVRRGERVEPYDTVRRRKDGSLVEIFVTISPVRDADGRIVGTSKIARDVTDRKRAEEALRLLAHEVDHRSKNLLMLVQATVHFSKADTPEAIKRAIEGRIQALARVHTLLAQSRWGGRRSAQAGHGRASPLLPAGERRAPRSLVSNWFRNRNRRS
jgi:PAS domain S-box-containing protein